MCGSVKGVSERSLDYVGRRRPHSVVLTLGAVALLLFVVSLELNVVQCVAQNI